MDHKGDFKRLLAGILGTPPIQVEGYLQAEMDRARLPPLSGAFEGGHALIIGVAKYPRLNPLPEAILNDARDLCTLLTEPTACGYPLTQVTRLLDDEAIDDGIRATPADLAELAGPDDTAVIFFSGHGDYDLDDCEAQQYILPTSATWPTCPAPPSPAMR